GGILQHFSLPENIRMSLFSARFLRNINEYLGVPNEPPIDLQFQPSGYLFLASPKDAAELEAAVQLQREQGGSQIFSPSPTPPGLENEGWFDPWTLLHAFRRKARPHPHFTPKTHAGFVTSADNPQDPEAARITYVHVHMADSLEYQPVACAVVVNAACVWGSQLSFGVPHRYVFSWHCPDGPGFSCPFLIDTSGAYFRRDGIAGNYLGGMSPPEEEEPDPSDLSVDDAFFQEQLWPRLARRVPAFESLKPRGSWAGYYDHNSFDQNGVLGPHPKLENLYVAAGFSGHGLQHA
ncbi:FAD-dependent oxidoreductase domain-containing protein 1, partial [Calypte anna]